MFNKKSVVVLYKKAVICRYFQLCACCCLLWIKYSCIADDGCDLPPESIKHLERQRYENFTQPDWAYFQAIRYDRRRALKNWHTSAESAARFVDKHVKATYVWDTLGWVRLYLRVFFTSLELNWIELNWTKLQLWTPERVHSTRTDWALIVLVSRQPINAWKRRATGSTCCGSVQFSSVHMLWTRLIIDVKTVHTKI